MRIGLGAGPTLAAVVTGRRARRISYDAAAEALFARFTTAPATSRKIAINTLITALKTSGLWIKLDALYLTAAHTAQAAQRNWKADAFNLTPMNSPAFTADRGYTGDGASSYLTTGFNPTFGGPHGFTQDSAHIGVYINANGFGSGGIIGNTNGTVLPLNGSSLTGRLHGAGGINGTLSPVTAVGHSVVSRLASNAVQIYKDSVQLNAAPSASLALMSEQMDICRRRQTSPTYQPARVAVAHWGSGLTPDDVAALRGHLLTYLTTLGAN